jgi:hypothetical protein
MRTGNAKNLQKGKSNGESKLEEGLNSAGAKGFFSELKTEELKGITEC